MRVGAIDIGSNSIRLLVGEVVQADNGGTSIRTVTRAGEPCRLARNLHETGRIEPDLAQRAAHMARHFVERARSLGAMRVVVGATAALRNASNGGEVAELIGATSGVPVRILTGEEEATLVYEAVVMGLGSLATRSACVVFDLGGGSTEVVSGVGERPGRWTSLPFGAVTLTERFLHSNPPSANEVEALTATVRESIMHACALFPEKTPVLAGVGGTMTILASMDRGLTQYEPTLIEGWAIERSHLAAMVDRFLAASVAERRSWPSMGEGRADIVAAGGLVVSLLAERFPAPALHCSTRGLRYGLARLAAQELAGSPAPDSH
jgi:exopolyphosphatase/guanosine-5'-triphosphate,3'-diphosphate pyrophosphatase